MAIDTDKIREEGKHATANEAYALLCDVLDEVDKLRKQLKSYPNYEKR